MDPNKLAEPFPAEDVKWRIGRSGFKEGKPWAKLLAYIDARLVVERLDEVCGPFGWKTALRFASIPDGVNRDGEAYKRDGFICSLSIRDDEGTWVTREDGAGLTDFEPFKGGISDAIKRAAANFGVGAYLYRLSETWADCSKEKYKYTYAKTRDGEFSWRAGKECLKALKAAAEGQTLAQKAMPPKQGTEPKKTDAASSKGPKITATQSQVQRIKMLQKEMGIADGPYRKRLKDKHGVTSCKDLSIAQADEVIQALEVAKKKSSDDEAKSTFGDGPSENDELRKLRKLAFDYLKVVSELGDDALSMMASTNDLPSERVDGNREWIAQTDDRDLLERGVLALEFIIKQHEKPYTTAER